MFDRSASVDDYLQRDLAGLNRRIERMKDPELGAVGAALREAFAATGCQEAVDTSLEVSAGFLPAENVIHYGQQDLRERRVLMIDKFHENEHALQWAAAAALSADPGNDNVSIILSPRDFVRALVLAEMDARAKQTWLLSLAAKDFHGLAARANDQELQLSVSAFRRLRRKTGSLQEALRQTASTTLGMQGCWIALEQGGEKTLREFYIDRYLGHYARAIGNRKDKSKLTVVALGDDDIRAIGGAFGPNTFTDDAGNVLPVFKDIRFSDAQERFIASLNKTLGITDEKSLPDFSATLRAQGQTEESFMAAAMPQQSASFVRPAP